MCIPPPPRRIKRRPYIRPRGFAAQSSFPARAVDEPKSSSLEIKAWHERHSNLLLRIRQSTSDQLRPGLAVSGARSGLVIAAAGTARPATPRPSRALLRGDRFAYVTQHAPVAVVVATAFPAAVRSRWLGVRDCPSGRDLVELRGCGRTPSDLWRSSGLPACRRLTPGDRTPAASPGPTPDDMRSDPLAVERPGRGLTAPRRATGPEASPRHSCRQTAGRCW